MSQDLPLSDQCLCCNKEKLITAFVTNADSGSTRQKYFDDYTLEISSRVCSITCPMLVVYLKPILAYSKPNIQGIITYNQHKSGL